MMELRTVCVWTDGISVTLRAFVAICGVLSPLVGSLDAASLLEYHFVEEQPPGSMVGNVLADYGTQPQFTQADLSQMRLNFRRTDGNYAYFVIEEDTGILRSSQVIDRESICPEFDTCDVQLDVVVNPSKFFHIIKIVVVIDDVNDQRPTFDPDSVFVEISESAPVGSVLSLRGATDRDSADYAVKRYELSPSGTPFDLRVTDHPDGTSAIGLRLVDSLDREFVDSYRLVVTAIDGGSPPKQGHLAVNVSVADSNDNAPLFDAAAYKVNVSESLAPGSPVVTVRATDRDAGWNAVVVYGFVQQTESLYGRMFRIDNVTGTITTRAALNYRSNEDVMHLRVKATDGGTSALFAIARVSITVLDTNNNAPELTISTLTESGVAEVDEHALIGSFVAHVKVSDADKGDSGKVTCRVTPASDFFLESQYAGEYKLLTARSFDREAEPGPKEALLRCEDGGTPPISSSVAIQVTIADINDHSPRIADEYRVSIAENNAIGALLVLLNATDDDSGQNAQLRYELTDPASPGGGGPDTAPVVVDRVTGEVTANVVFDYERRRLYTQRVTVCDQGDPRRCASTTMTVEVSDVNDEAPVFSRATYHFDVAENQLPGTVVGSVAAEDADANPVYRRTVYSVRGFDGYFDVDADTGELRTLRALDREERAVYRGSVSAVDKDSPSLRATAAVVVRVSDENDNVPTVIFPVEKDPTVQFPCRAPAGSTVARVRATDPDDGPAGTVTYFLATNSNFTPLFEIDPTTGVISVTGVTPLECGVVWVTVQVTDNGVPRRSTLFDIFVSLNASIVPTNSKISAADGSGGGGDQETSGLTSSSRHDYVILFPTLVLGVVVLIVGIVAVFFLYRCHRQKQKKKKRKQREVEEAEEEEEEERKRRGRQDADMIVDEMSEPADTFNERIDFHEMTRLKRHHHNMSRSRSLNGSRRAIRYVSEIIGP